MEKKTITFSANEQKLIKTGGMDCYASNTVAYIEAHFDLGENWSGYDSVRAVWWNDYNKTVATVLDSEGTCVVPYEVLTRKSAVKVNLVGSIAENDVLTDRLTTCPVVALTIKCNAKTDGDNAQPITPSQFEQFVQNVKADADRAEAGATASAQSAQSASESATASANSATSSEQSATASAESAQNAQNSAISAENAKDDAEDARDEILGMRATATTLEAGSDATASYSDGLLTLGIPRGDKGVKGDTGETGATPNISIGTVETLEPTEDATATITGTVEEPILNLGIPKGDTGEVSLEDLEALLPTETASGSIVTITDGQAIVPAKSLKVALEPIQSGSGTPSPDNVRPISGRTEVVTQRTGKNILDDALMVNRQLDIATGAIGNNNLAIRVTAFKVPVKADYVTVSVQSPYQVGSSCAYDANGDYISSIPVNAWKDGSWTFQLPSGTCYFSTNFRKNDNTALSPSDLNAQFELGSTATDYEPYDGATYHTDLGRTVYGGTLDAVSGVLTVDRAMVTLDGTTDKVEGQYGSGIFYTNRISGIYDDSSASRQREVLIVCDKIKAFSWVGLASATDGIAQTAGVRFGLRLPNASSVTEANAWLSSNTPTICYELATPQTIQLTPQEVQLLLGTNNVWSDGDVTIVYNADIQLWVEKKLS